MNYNEWLELLPPAVKNDLSEEELIQRYNNEMGDFPPPSDKTLLDTMVVVTKKGNRYNAGAIYNLEFSEKEVQDDKDIVDIYFWITRLINGEMFDVWSNLFDKYRIPLEDFLEAYPHGSSYESWLEKVEISEYNAYEKLSPNSYTIRSLDGYTTNDLYKLLEKYGKSWLEPLDLYPDSLRMARAYVAYEIGKKKYDRATKYSDILKRELALMKG